MNNIYHLPSSLPPQEVFEALVSTKSVRIERIISTGQITPIGQWYDQTEVDILTALLCAVIPKPHDLGFCFLATASTHKEFWSYVRSTDYPRKPCGSYVSKSQKENSYVF